ncbi:hypothetical protein OK016_17680 [Vibrio chagasii]|nr:hypothetical protein [Vibrio chagasii]
MEDSEGWPKRTWLWQHIQYEPQVWKALMMASRKNGPRDGYIASAANRNGET